MKRKDGDSKMKSVYIETTVPSLATARPSKDTVTYLRQMITLEFCESYKQRFDVYTSFYTVSECMDGDSAAAARRMEFLNGIPVLNKRDDIEQLGDIYMDLLKIPPRAKIDSRHLAAAVIYKMDYLLTWNFTHMGPITYALLYEYNNSYSPRLHTPIMLTPEQLIEIERNEAK